MTVLDAYAVIAYLRDERGAAEVTTLLRAPTTLAAVNAAEVMDQMVRVWRQDSDEVEVALAMLARDGMTITDATASIAFEAGRLRATHYDKKLCSVSMADCFTAATALLGGRAVATSDPHLLAIMLAEKGKVHPLPARRGNSPEVS